MTTQSAQRRSVWKGAHSHWGHPFSSVPRGSNCPEEQERGVTPLSCLYQLRFVETPGKINSRKKTGHAHFLRGSTPHHPQLGSSAGCGTHVPESSTDTFSTEDALCGTSPPSLAPRQPWCLLVGWLLPAGISRLPWNSTTQPLTSTGLRLSCRGAPRVQVDGPGRAPASFVT